MGFVKTFFKKVVSWIIGFIKKRVILAIISIFTPFLVNEIKDIVANIITQMNKIILTNIYRIENELFVIQNKVFDAAEEYLAWLIMQIDELLNKLINEAISLLFDLVGFVLWVKAFFNDLQSQTNETLKTIIQEIIHPIINKIIQIENNVTDAQALIFDSQNDLDAQIQSLNDALMATVQSGVDNHNEQVRNLISKINSLMERYNSDFSNIKNRYESFKSQLSIYNSSLQNEQNTIKQFLIANLNSNSPLQQIDRDTLIENTLSNVRDSFLISVQIEIVWEQYSYNLESNTGFLQLSIDLPQVDSEFVIPTGPFLAIASDIEALRLLVSDIPEDARVLLAERLPQYIAGVCDNKIKLLLGLVAKKMVGLIKERTSTKLSEVKDLIHTNGKLPATSIQAKAKEIKGDILNSQSELLKKIPGWLRPTLEKIVTKTKDKLIETQAKTELDADKLLDYKPPIEDIERIYNGFPNEVKPHDEPNIKDAKEWTIQDIYRVLCDYFFRTERLALIARIAQDDIQIDIDVLFELIQGIDN